MTPDNALICLKILAAGCVPPFPEKEVMAKFESALRRVLSKERNIAAEVREWVNITFSYFSITDLLRDITIITSEEKNRARVAIHRLCEDGILERAPGKHGVYRRIERECDDIDFLHVNTDTENIVLPFNLHKWVEILPGNVIIVAGEPDAGKTAFLLNVVRQNMYKYDVWYFSSEMFGKEFNTRLRKFEGIRLDEWKFHAKSRASNFADVVRPGRGTINIIDFLEVYKDFYEVGGMIADIHAKLDGAIAIIALQKNQGAEVGVGGFRSLEKARLYLNMSRDNKIQIYKAKNWKDPSRNPNKRVLEYRIHGGCNLEARTDWVRP